MGSICKRNATKKQSEKGSAMVMTVAVIMVIMVLGIIALFASSANIAMSTRVQSWAKEYYSLDKNVRIKVDLLDSKLEEAEKLAQKYLSLSIYKYEYNSMPVADKSVFHGDDLYWYSKIKQIISQNAQNFFNMRWNNEVDLHYDQFDSQKYNEKLAKYLEEAFERLYYYFTYKIINNEIHTGIFKEENAENGLQYRYEFNENASLQGKVYSSIDLETTDAFWDSYSFNEIEPFIFRIAAKNPDRTLYADIFIHKPQYNLISKTKNVPFEGNPIWSYAIFARNNICFLSNVQGEAGEGAKAMICGDIFSADFSEYSHAKGTHVIEEGNMNGISVQNAKVDIYGNVYCRGDVHITRSSQDSKSSLNVLAYDDLLNVQGISSSDKIKRDFKYNMYGKNKFFVDYRLFEEYSGTVREMIKKCSAWYQENDAKDFAKILPSDYEGGNIYCNNLSIEESASYANIEVTGNVWTYDDIQIDADNSNITVNGVYAGLRSTSTEKDPNASSCVINNKPESSKIYLRNDFIIPGTAFVKLDENGYYQTVESAGARISETFSAYMDEENTFNEDKFEFDNYMIDNMELRLIKHDKYQEQAGLFAESVFSKLINYFKTSAMPSNTTGIIFDNQGQIENKIYVLGSAIGSKQSNLKVFSKYDTDVKYSSNQLAYNTIKDVLQKLFVSKSFTMGTRGAEHLNVYFDSFYNESAINSMSGNGEISYNSGSSAGAVKRIIIKDSPSVYRKVSELYDEQHQNALVFLFFKGKDSSSKLTLEVDRDFYGIIFSLNDIEIKGAKNIKGSVISMGSILFECSNSINLRYDEDVIRNMLIRDRDIYEFFRLPQTHALPAPAFYAIRDEVAESTLERDNVAKKTKRFSIRTWVLQQNY